jgi:hypothetical protein
LAADSCGDPSLPVSALTVTFPMAAKRNPLKKKDAFVQLSGGALQTTFEVESESICQFKFKSLIFFRS